MTATRFWWYSSRCLGGLASLLVFVALAASAFLAAIARCRR